MNQDKIEEVAVQTYEFVHRGKTHMTWAELPFKWGKKSYLEFAQQIRQLFEPKLSAPTMLTDEEIINSFDEKKHFKNGVFDFLKFGRVIEGKTASIKDARWRQILRDTITMEDTKCQQRINELTGAIELIFKLPEITGTNARQLWQALKKQEGVE